MSAVVYKEKFSARGQSLRWCVRLVVCRHPFESEKPMVRCRYHSFCLPWVRAGIRVSEEKRVDRALPADTHGGKPTRSEHQLSRSEFESAKDSSIIHERESEIRLPSDRCIHEGSHELRPEIAKLDLTKSDRWHGRYFYSCIIEARLSLPTRRDATCPRVHPTRWAKSEKPKARLYWAKESPLECGCSQSQAEAVIAEYRPNRTAMIAANGIDSRGPGSYMLRAISSAAALQLSSSRGIQGDEMGERGCFP